LKIRICFKISLGYRFRTTTKPVFKRRRHADNLSVPTLENCLTEYKVLKDFYYDKGGKKVVPEQIAMKVFSKEACRAGRCAIREELYDQACELLSQSFQQHPNIKSLTYWLVALSKQALNTKKQS